MDKNSTTIEITQLRNSNLVLSETSQPLNPALENKRNNDDGGDFIVESEVDPQSDVRRKGLAKTELHRINSMNYAGNKNLAEGLMDIALLSANANQLRFLLTYNDKARTYYMSLGLVGLSLVLQVVVGLALIFKVHMNMHPGFWERHLKRTDRRYTYAKEFLICGVFVITVVNVLLAAFTTTESVEKT